MTTTAGPMTDYGAWGSHEWYDRCWEAVSPEMREKIVNHLHAKTNESFWAEVREAISQHGSHDWIHKVTPYGGAHHGWGTSVRNVLRKAVADEELPPAPYPGGKSHSNWDDYYIQALEEAAKRGQTNE